MAAPYKTISKSFVSKKVELDKKYFEDCSFTNCTFIFSGGLPPVLIRCSFENCSWQFADQAANTLGFLSGLYAGGFDGMVESTFHGIRKGQFLELPNNQATSKPNPIGIPSEAKSHPLVSRVPKIVKVPKPRS